jgi:hypothetical protein
MDSVSALLGHGDPSFTRSSYTDVVERGVSGARQVLEVGD